MNIKQRAKKAIDNNEIISYFEGEGDYKIELHQWVSGCVPTDFASCLSDGIYEVCNEYKSGEIQTIIENALLEMLNMELI